MLLGKCKPEFPGQGCSAFPFDLLINKRILNQNKINCLVSCATVCPVTSSNSVLWKKQKIGYLQRHGHTHTQYAGKALQPGLKMSHTMHSLAISSTKISSPSKIHNWGLTPSLYI
jgi:hypothetical protein